MSEEKEFLEKAMEDIEKEQELVILIETKLQEMRELAVIALDSQDDQEVIYQIQNEIYRIQQEIYEIYRNKVVRLH